MDIDVIIIGGGIGGLFCGVLLAKKGLKVVILERNKEFGGYAGRINDNGFSFDVGPHLMFSYGRRGLQLAEELGIDSYFIKIKPHCSGEFPNETIIWGGQDRFVESLSERFPYSRRGLKKMFKIMRKLYNEGDVLYNIYPKIFMISRKKGWENSLSSFPYLRRYLLKTGTQFMDEFINNQKLKGILSTFWFYQALPPSKLAAPYFTSTLMSPFKNGVFYFKGGCFAMVEKWRCCKIN